MDTDIDFSLEDEPIQPEVDPDDQYLLDEQEVVDDTEAKKREAEEARLQTLVDRKVANYFTRPQEPPVQPRRQEPAPAPAPSVLAGLSESELIDKMADDITNDLALDPKAAVRKVLQATRAMSTQASETAIERTNRQYIEQYRQSREKDPLFKAIKEDWDSEVDTYTPRQLATSTPAQVRRAMEAAEDQALGRYYKKQLEDKRNRAVEPPRYGGGSSRGTAGGVAPARISAEEKQLIAMAKSSGLSDKDIRELVRENRKK
jgi:hypothetical protein